MRILLGIVCVCIAFVLGFLVRGNTALMSSLGIDTGADTEKSNPTSMVSGSTLDSISARVAEVEGILKANSVVTIDLPSATYNMLNQFASITNDPYFVYFTEERYATYMKDSASGDYAGIGVLFAEYDGAAYAVDIFDGSVAQAAGVMQGDFVVSIDGNRADGWTTTEVTNAITKAEGDSVIITWRRPSTLEAEGGEEFSTTLAVSTYKATNVTTELSDSVGIINIKQITQNSAELVSAAVASLKDQGATSYVLDLRDCPGGYLTQAVNIASLFIKSGVIVQIQTNSETTNKTASGSTVTDAPLVVLVNKNTAAAAEVLAGALQDANRATIVGAKTLGKGSVQVIHELSFGGAIRYTAAYYKTPNGVSINNTGITPDMNVSAAATQKAIAIETAASK